MSLIGVHLTPRISHRNLPQRLLKVREALMARDPVRLRQQLEQHLRHKLQAVLDSFNLQDPSP